jgi:hypothetical protein
MQEVAEGSLYPYHLHGGGCMANVAFAGGPAGYSAINMDLVRYVTRDIEEGTVTLYFDMQHKIELDGDVAKDFIDIITRLKSEAGAAIAAMKKGNPTDVWKNLS